MGHLEPFQGRGPVEWITEQSTREIATELPRNYAAYAVVFHPAYAHGSERWVRWSEIAASNGHDMHAGARWESISTPRVGLGGGHHRVWDLDPDEGTLPEPAAADLVALLADHTSTSDSVWFCAWMGWAALRWGPTDERASALLTAGGRPKRRRSLYVRSKRGRKADSREAGVLGGKYVLLSGDVTGGTESVVRQGFTSPSLWWPEDRSWFFATPIYSHFSYLAGSAKCIAEAVGHQRLEVYETTVPRSTATT